MWSCDVILELLLDSLRAEDQRQREEQAVHGLDRLSEVALHAVIARGLTASGLGVFREIVYPCAPVPASRRTERQRCDLVLTDSPARAPVDPDERRRAAAASAGTLFAHTAPPPDFGCPPERAFWLELKLVGQFAFNRGVPVPNATYASELTAGPAADLRKLSADPMIRHGAAGLILFNSDPVIARHDVAALRDRAAKRGDARALIHGEFPIPDRIGNRVCSVVLAPAR